MGRVYYGEGRVYYGEGKVYYGKVYYEEDVGVPLLNVLINGQV